jgi:hypothetical protein
VQNILLGLGALLVGVAAVALATVAVSNPFGRAAILAVATATAEGIKRVAEATRAPGGAEAIQLRVAEQYIGEFGKVINNADTIILPANVADVASMITTAMNVVQQARK